jgi:hypothetical protein
VALGILSWADLSKFKIKLGGLELNIREFRLNILNYLKALCKMIADLS